MGKTHLTVDFEYDWGGRVKQIYAIEQYLPKVLETLSRQKATATFFISTETLSVTGEFVLEIKKMGHEIASHGHEHLINYERLSKDKLFDQIKKSKDLLEDLVNEPVVGFRTPQFRKNQYTEEVLTKLDFLYDSSEVSVALFGRYESHQFINKELPEFPVSGFFDKFPAGTKWYNLLFNLPEREVGQVTYIHLFDLLSLWETIQNFKPGVNFTTRCFYMARFLPIYNSFSKLSQDSVSLKRLLVV